MGGRGVNEGLCNAIVVVTNGGGGGEGLMKGYAMLL